MNDRPSPPVLTVVRSVGPDEADRVRDLFDRALALDEQDDRFDAWPAAVEDAAALSADEGDRAAAPATDHPERVELIAGLGEIDGRLAGFVGGPIEDGTAHLDAVIDGTVDDPAGLLASLVAAVTPDLLDAGAGAIQLWGRPARSWHAEVAERLGGREVRALHQMRCPLPVHVEPVPTRAYRAHDDLAALRDINNRAFAAHPDQGRQTDESLLATMAQPWFDPEGVRLHERDARLAGFCWTKIHRARASHRDPAVTTQPLGEIYVIGVDPDFHGQGLGGPTTAAGLAWLHEQGLGTGMLYVEADNVPAVRTYERLGFTVLRTDRAWLLPTGNP